MRRSIIARWQLMAIGATVALVAVSIAPGALAADLESTTDPLRDTTAAVTDPVRETVQAVKDTVAETTETVTGTVEETVSGESGDKDPSTDSPKAPADSSADEPASGVSDGSGAAGVLGQKETTPTSEKPASTTRAGGGSRGAARSGTTPRSDAGIPSSPARATRELSTPTVPAALNHEMVMSSSPALQANSFGGPADLFRSLARSGQGLIGGDSPVLGMSGDQFSAALVFVLLALALVAVGKGALRLDTAKPA